MSAPRKLTDEEIAARLGDVAEWKREGDMIRRTFAFDD